MTVRAAASSLVFGVTLYLSAFLLFLVQPMIAKMILPALGGAPAVWNTCIVIFQVALLVGYAYAHVSTTGLARAYRPSYTSAWSCWRFWSC